MTIARKQKETWQTVRRNTKLYFFTCYEDCNMSFKVGKYHSKLLLATRAHENKRHLDRIPISLISKTKWSMILVFRMCSFEPHCIILLKFHKNRRGSTRNFSENWLIGWLAASFVSIPLHSFLKKLWQFGIFCVWSASLLNVLTWNSKTMTCDLIKSLVYKLEVNEGYTNVIQILY